LASIALAPGYLFRQCFLVPGIPYWPYKFDLFQRDTLKSIRTLDSSIRSFTMSLKFAILGLLNAIPMTGYDLKHQAFDAISGQPTRARFTAP
jgi:hypothetical protein